MSDEHHKKQKNEYSAAYEEKTENTCVVETKEIYHVRFERSQYRCCSHYYDVSLYFREAVAKTNEQLLLYLYDEYQLRNYSKKKSNFFE